MRLLAVEECDPELGHLALANFEGAEPPAYAIFSHRWGEDEVQFGDIEQKSATTRKGYPKVKGVISQARKDGHAYLWVDLCCIDKRSSVELSEALNSMWKWYREATICYAYLSDVTYTPEQDDFESQFCSSAWFKRGWTLQELIAPRTVSFFNHDWDFLGTKQTLRESISMTTGIETAYLTNTRPLSHASIAKRMSWAADRSTARPEDIAYCLMGIFNVNMPLVYGEGKRAFLRLQQEILETSSDESLFAWVDLSANAQDKHGLLADSPRHFQNSRNIFPLRSLSGREPSKLTNQGICIQHGLVNGNEMSLLCQYQGRAGYMTIFIHHLVDSDQWVRVRTDQFGSCSQIRDLSTFYFPQKVTDVEGFATTQNTSLPFLLHLSHDMRRENIYRECGRVDGIHPTKTGKIKSNTKIQHEVTMHNIPKHGSYVDILIQFVRPADNKHLIVMIGSLSDTEIGFCASDVNASSMYELKANARAKVWSRSADHVPDRTRPRTFTDAYHPAPLGATVDLGASHRVRVRKAGERWSVHRAKMLDLLEIDVVALDEPEVLPEMCCTLQ